MKQCLHPEAALGVCTKIINAHTVQRAGSLQALCDSSNHVLSFYPFIPDDADLPKLQRVGWRRASTFTGFCAYHDASTFASLEQGEFVFDAEMGFLASYRALCHEMFQKVSSERCRIRLQPLIDRGQPPEMQYQIQHEHRVSLDGVRKAITDLKNVKANMDQDLLSRDYSPWAFICLNFSGTLCVATSGAPTPNQNLNGETLQVLHDPNTTLQHLFISMMAAHNSPKVVFGWRQSHYAPQKLVASLLRMPVDQLPAYIVQYVFAHLENVYFSSEWWDSLSPSEQEQVHKLAGNANAYYFPPEYSQKLTLPWSLISVEKINARF